MASDEHLMDVLFVHFAASSNIPGRWDRANTDPEEERQEKEKGSRKPGGDRRVLWIRGQLDGPSFACLWSIARLPWVW